MHYRATESFAVGSGDGPDIQIQDGRTYDDRDANIKQIVKRFPDKFVPLK